ncbi:hypothetical protein HB662_28005 [Roseomonas frigidaquae]|uniref:Uncharacterized protein n=1 Tax=Falsiroseomonas frigidaquae TaxID=487318 RepID=A0ABX1F8C6_9PROT|nr:hypothetical protein [Falsiroseomonas frigidaquae]NKE48643.1 hypothetical protein [Falsiroseomonas frigidaquae]
MAKGPVQRSGGSAISSTFAQATPKAFARVGGNPASVKALAAIERRTTAIKEKAVQHAEKFRDRWTAKEAIRLWQHRLAQNAKYPAPPGEDRSISPEEMLKIASRNVQARTMRRLASINTIKARMTNAVVRNLDSPKLTQSFEEATRDQRPTQHMQMRRKP